MTKDNAYYTLGFANILSIGPVKFQKIIRVFGDAKTAWEAPIEEYLQRRIPDDIVAAVEKNRPHIDLKTEWEKLSKLNMRFIDLSDTEYPPLLKEISNPPIGLFVRGTIPSYEVAVAVVGTRKATPYGLQATDTIARELGQRDVLVISGLALGIDTAAHKGTLKVSGKTIAVLGGGLDEPTLYPPSNRKLANEITEKAGAVISEYPPTTPSLVHHFPHRNRIISGLAQATIVVEANLESGSLITARLALEQNREVLAVPGNITNPSSIGPNSLIKQGAHPITTVDDIFEVLNIPRLESSAKAKTLFPSSPDEKTIYEHLSDQPTERDLLAENTGLDTKILNSTLTIMEMKGLVKHVGEGKYIKL